MTDEPTAGTGRPPSLLDATLPLVALAVLIAGALLLFGLDALDGPLQAALTLCCLVPALIAVKNGHPWSRVQRAGQGALSSVTSAVFILLAVGALIGLWNLSGTIPTLVHYGLQLLSASWYYPATAVICGVVALSIGSSWTTAGTVGVGLVGVSTLVGVSPEITAGAVISGAYLGDKLSPLSETTVLTAQLVEVDVRAHIRRQAWTSVPAFGLAVVGFTVLGLVRPTGTDAVPETMELHALADVYWITPLNLLPLALLVVLSVKKVPVTVTLAAAGLFGGALGAVLQSEVYDRFVTDDRPAVLTGVQAVWQAMANGFTSDTGVTDVDRLLSRGGMDSMLPTVWLVLAAVTFGFLLEEFGLINRLVDPLVRAARGTGRLFLAVFACAFGLNVVAGDQYIALVLPARTFKAEFARRRLAPTNLSRLTADSGTVTSALVPWNSCGAFMTAALGVSTLAYLPYAFFNILSPALSVAYGVTGFRIERLDPAPAEDTDPAPT